MHTHFIQTTGRQSLCLGLDIRFFWHAVANLNATDLVWITHWCQKWDSNTGGPVAGPVQSGGQTAQIYRERATCPKMTEVSPCARSFDIVRGRRSEAPGYG